MAEKPRLGNKVRRLRLRHGLTQVDLAGRLGISASYLNLIEHDRRPLSANILLRLAQHFDFDLKTVTAGHNEELVADLVEAATWSVPESSSTPMASI